MARNKATLQNNIDLSDPSNYLNGRIKDNTGSGDGTPVNERVYGDFHQMVAKLMNLSGLSFNNLPENETNGYQFIDSLRNLASKNDLNYNLGKEGSILTLPIRLGSVTNNEIIRAKATFDKGSETLIKGTLDNSDNKTVTYLGTFKENEYLRIIKTTASVLIIREVDAFNLGAIVEELNYLKAATQAQEDSGSSNEVATTPLTNKTVFTERVNGDDSGDYLATTDRNGLLSAAFWDIINGIGTPALRNRGHFDLGNIASHSPGTTLVPVGQLTASVSTAGSDFTEVEVTFSNEMDNTSYKLDVSVQSSGNSNFDNDYYPINFRIVSTNKAKLYFQKRGNVTTDLKVHVDVIQL